MAFRPDGRWLASAGAKRPIKLWDVSKGKLLRTFSGHGAWVLSLAFSPDGSLLASGSRDRAIKLWDPATGSLLRTIPNAFFFGPGGEPGWPPYAAPLAFSRDGSRIVSGSGDGRIRIWDPRTGALKRTLFVPPIATRRPPANPKTPRDPGAWCKTPLFYPRGPRRIVFAYVSSLAFSPDGGCLATGTWDGAIRLWDFSTGALVHTLRADASSVRSVAFSPDGSRLASASHDSSIKLWKRVDATSERGRASEASTSVYEKASDPTALPEPQKLKIH
jgi:WD40 repeat protein